MDARFAGSQRTDRPEEKKARISRTICSGWSIRYVEQPEDEARARMGDDGFRMFEFFKSKGYHVDIPMLEADWGYRMTRSQEFLDAVDLPPGQPP